MINWLLCAPLEYGPTDGNWWVRNAGLIALALRRMDINARLLTLGPSKKAPGRPHIQAELEQLARPDWWQSQRAGVVVWGGGNNPRFLPVVRAIRAAGAQLFLHLDSDGLVDPRVNYRDYLIKTAGTAFDEERPFPRLRAVAKTLLHAAAPSRVLSSLAAYHDLAAGAFSVTPVAAERLRTFLQQHGRGDLAARIHFLPHAVTEDMVPGPESQRSRRIVAIGRWDAFQKNTPLLLDVLRCALDRFPGYGATLIGIGDAAIRARLAKWPASLSQRVEIRGLVPHDALPGILKDARICLITSRWESFHIGAAEALCCGCSVVGPANLPALPYFTAGDSGTLAARSSLGDCCSALTTEIDAWENGRRNATDIGARWGHEVHASSVARKMAALVEAETGRIT